MLKGGGGWPSRALGKAPQPSRCGPVIPRWLRVVVEGAGVSRAPARPHWGVSLPQVNGKELSKLSQEQTLEALRTSKEPLVIQVLRRSPRLRGDGSCHDLQLVDSGTQTDITFEHIMALGKLRPPTPPMVILEPFVPSEL